MKKRGRDRETGISMYPGEITQCLWKPEHRGKIKAKEIDMLIC